MAYQPKFARKRDASLPGLLITLVLVPLSLVLSALLLKQMFFRLGASRPVVPETVPAVTVSHRFQTHFSDVLEEALWELNTGDVPDAPPPIAETLPPYEVLYTLEEDLLVAPEPDQALFGQTTDPAVLADVLKQAEYILDGQELLFSPEIPLFKGSTVRYYLDETIFAITWKEARDKSVYTFSEVKIGHASQFRRHLSDGQYGSGKLYLPTEMAATVNAVVATSGDFYANRPIFGVVAYDGEVRRNVDDGYAETCYIDRKGDLVFSHMKELKNTKNAQAFLEEHDIQFSLAFGPILVENYEVRELPNVYGVGEIREEYARSALCQMDELHYLIAVANWEGDQPEDPTVARFQKVIATTGCRMAYCLDGGQTAAVVMNDQLINRPAKGEQRRISDIIYFATAVPEGG